MTFYVQFSDGTPATTYDNEDIYEFLVGGVLAIRYGDPAKLCEYYPPQQWAKVTAEANHQPGDTYGVSEGAYFLGD